MIYQIYKNMNNIHNISNKDYQKFIALETLYNFFRIFTLYGYTLTLIRIKEKVEEEKNDNLYNILKLKFKEIDMFEVIDYVFEFTTLGSEIHQLFILALISTIIILLSYTPIIKDTVLITLITGFIINLFLVNVKDLLDPVEIIAITLITALLLLFIQAINEKD